MEFLARALDDPAPKPCGKCMNCTGQTQRHEIPRQTILEAVEFLRGDEIVIETRKQWPSAALDEIQKVMPDAINLTQQGRPSLKIPEELRPQQGRSLSIYGDAGWGRAVAGGKYDAKHFSDQLAQATARLIRERWRPEPFPEWITCVPSNRQPTLVLDFANRLAAILNVTFIPVIAKNRETEPQKSMENSTQQVRNLLGAFSVGRDILPAPVLLVDDVIDSGWTLTMIAALLRLQGSGPVFPFVLARATAGDS
jgi:ATP-dependent DNA helicase RecQ